MKIAILTMFNGLEPTYSLVNVVYEHIDMLLKAGISVRLLVSEDCPDSARYGVFADSRVDWVKVTNRLHKQFIHWHDYTQTFGNVHQSFFEEASEIASDLVIKLKDCDVCMMHDILYQGWHLIHNIAIRTAQQALPKLKFISFSHSLPIPPPLKCEPPFNARFIPMPNTIFAYPTKSGLPALAKQYDVSIESCSELNHTYSFNKYKSDSTIKVSNNIDLLTPEIIIIYPARLTAAKKLEKVAAFAGAMKKHANGVSLIFCDFPAEDTCAQNYKAIIRHNGKRFGLDDKDMLFTSDIGYANGFPHESVLELFSISNLFICPSFSESFGLTVLEAAAAKNILVLNEAVPALKELGEQLSAYFLRWDALGYGTQTFEHYHPTEEVYYNEHCALIIDDMRENKTIQAQIILRQKFNQDYIFKTQFLKLLK